MLSLPTHSNNLTLRPHLSQIPASLCSFCSLRRRTLLVLIFGFLTLIVTLGHLQGLRISHSSGRSSGYKSSYYSSGGPPTWKGGTQGVNVPGRGARNETLGFGKIFYISMKDRTDRQDMMTLIAGYMNLQLTMVDAASGIDVSDKAKPWDVKNPPPNVVRPAELGCWRSHANIWEEVVSSGISSALILEDDADFSVGIRDIMELISNHLHHITGARNDEPYGLVNDNSWDILTLGHCYFAGDENPPANKYPKSSKIFEAWEDPWAPSRGSYNHYIPWSLSKRIRVLLPMFNALCTQGYAVSREGAMRLLYNVGGPGGILNAPVDMVMADKMQKGLLKGYITLPSVFGQYKYGSWKDTDVQTPSEEEIAKTETGGGPDVVNSVRDEIKNVMGPGSRNVWKEMEEGR